MSHKTTHIFEAVGYIHTENRKLLLAKSKKNTAYYMPGGKVNEGESNIQALVREIGEELSVNLKPETVLFHGVFEAQAHGKPEGTRVRMTCYVGEHEGVIKANNEIEKLEYFSYDEFFKTTDIPPAGTIIIKDLKKNNLID